MWNERRSYVLGEISVRRFKDYLNESAIATMGLKDPIGKTVFLEMFNNRKQIIGVVKDFHYESLHKKVSPCFFMMYRGGRKILVKIQGWKDINRLAPEIICTQIKSDHIMINLAEIKILSPISHILRTYTGNASKVTSVGK